MPFTVELTKAYYEEFSIKHRIDLSDAKCVLHEDGYTAVRGGTHAFEFSISGQIADITCTGSVSRIVLCAVPRVQLVFSDTNTASLTGLTGPMWTTAVVVFNTRDDSAERSMRVAFRGPGHIELGGSLSQSIADTSGEDFTLVCKDRETVAINRAVAAAACGCFRQTEGFKVSDSMDLLDFDVAVVKTAKRIMYERCVGLRDIWDLEIIPLMYHLCFEHMDAVWELAIRTLDPSNCGRLLDLANTFGRDTVPIVKFIRDNIQTLEIADTAAFAKAFMK